jgi:hypothetical protein
MVKCVISVDCHVNDGAILLWYKKPLIVEFLTNEQHHEQVLYPGRERIVDVVLWRGEARTSVRAWR